MKVIAGVDIGNSTTEVCIAQINGDGSVRFLSDSACPTTGTKGTVQNIPGIRRALEEAAIEARIVVSDLDVVRLNEAAPVIGDTAMETISETIITASSMLGHNPDTPAGIGLATGLLVEISALEQCVPETGYIVLVDSRFDFEEIAGLINRYSIGMQIKGLILQSDEAVLVENRLINKIPIIDEVRAIHRIEPGRLAAIEVAPDGETVRMLSNPYGIATMLELNPNETKAAVPIAKSLIGKRSAVVIKTPFEQSAVNVLPAGEIVICSENGKTIAISIDAGAGKIMEALHNAEKISQIYGSTGSNAGAMFDKIKGNMSALVNEAIADIRVKDILAIDTWVPVQIPGALSGETCLEKAVGIAAMVKTAKLPMEQVAAQLMEQTGVFVKVAGVEAVMACLGALTTPGTQLPLAILDLGGGSTDAAVIDTNGQVRSVHLAGAGELVTMLIQTELGLADRAVAERIKRFPLAKVESLFHRRLENGAVQFFEQPFEPRFFGSVVLLAEQGQMIKIEEPISMEKIAHTRTEAKRKVFVTNALRALKSVAENGDITSVPNVVLVGGSAQDFEIADLLMQELADYGVVCGRGNIRRTMGARNAVATGLVMSY